MRADGSHAHRLAMASSGFDVEPRYAPDGRWIAFDRLRPIPNGQLQAAFLVSDGRTEETTRTPLEARMISGARR